MFSPRTLESQCFAQISHFTQKTEPKLDYFMQLFKCNQTDKTSTNKQISLLSLGVTVYFIWFSRNSLVSSIPSTVDLNQLVMSKTLNLRWPFALETITLHGIWRPEPHVPERWWKINPTSSHHGEGRLEKQSFPTKILLGVGVNLPWQRIYFILVPFFFLVDLSWVAEDTVVFQWNVNKRTSKQKFRKAKSN